MHLHQFRATYKWKSFIVCDNRIVAYISKLSYLAINGGKGGASGIASIAGLKYSVPGMKLFLTDLGTSVSQSILSPLICLESRRLE